MFVISISHNSNHKIFLRNVQCWSFITVHYKRKLCVLHLQKKSFEKGISAAIHYLFCIFTIAEVFDQHPYAISSNEKDSAKTY